MVMDWYDLTPLSIGPRVEGPRVYEMVNEHFTNFNDFTYFLKPAFKTYAQFLDFIYGG